MSKRFEPRPYQELIINHILTHPRCAIWAGMGMGKTVSTLTAIQTILDCFDDRRVLIIAPLRVAQSTWPDEIAKWEHLKFMRVSVICGSAAERKRALFAAAHVFCINYENLPWLMETLGGEWPFGTVVADESTRLKSFRSRGGSIRAKALAAVADKCDRFIELTGTPTANGLLDLWGQTWFLDGGKRLGKTISAYEQAYFYPVKTGGEAYMVKWIPKHGSDEKIRAKLSDLSLTVNAEDWWDIAKPISEIVSVDLPAKARAQYEELERDFYLELESGEKIEAVNALSKMTKCLQFASGALYTEDGYEPVHDAKLEALRSIVEEASGAPILVAYQFKHELDRIRKAFPKARLLDKNPNTIRQWNRGEIQMLLAHPASCGHGLNLQDGGQHLVFFSSGFNYEQDAQMCERIGPTRQAQAGHPRPVFIYRIVAKQTLEHAVLGALGKKKDVLDFILERKK